MEITPLDAGLVKVTLVGRLDSPGVDRIETSVGDPWRMILVAISSKASSTL
jgi:hypothetical protein